MSKRSGRSIQCHGRRARPGQCTKLKRPAALAAGFVASAGACVTRCRSGGYDAAGRRTQLAEGGGLFMTYDYDTLGEATGDVKAYLEWILSDAGQAIVAKSGYAPVPADKRGKG